MKTIFSSSAFPPISYVIRMLLAENVFTDLGENYIKQTYRNRYEIYTAAGKKTISIPVKKQDGNHTSMHRILLSDHEPWQRTHWRTIKAAYQNSPFFIHYEEEVKSLIQTESKYLYQYNDACLQGIFSLLEISFQNEYTKEYFEGAGIDLRNYFTPKSINDVTIELKALPYHQVFEEKYGFIADLSILDLLFNLGPEATSYLEKAKAVYLSASAG